jgi:choline kinase
MGSAASGQPEVAVVVLAAGHGSRLGPHGGPGPKWLIEVAGGPVAESHLTAVEEALGPDTDVVVVVGHAADRVERYCRDRAGRRPLRPRLVVNRRYSDLNNWYSLLVGLDALEGRLGHDGVVVVLNSDLFALPAWIGAVLEAAAELGDAPGVLAVDLARPLTDEAMKVAAGPRDAVGRRWCTAIGKVGVEHAVGEYVGMAALGPSGRYRVHHALRRLEAAGERPDAWYEGAFQDVTDVSPFLAVLPTPSSAWVEIDDVDDLRVAHLLAAAGDPPRRPARASAPALSPPTRSGRHAPGS